ncbi:DUF6884 domain-containing protein [Halorubrum pallidum]|uniref:DUF6884 domain-containing protein n=1 Tax=Halorubrum pallidum TaxID=1526114 RepID=A0ABD5SXM8_9EURY
MAATDTTPTDTDSEHAATSDDRGPSPTVTSHDDGSLTVTKDSSIPDFIRDESEEPTVEIAPADAPLFRILMDVFEGIRLPDLMPARLARECASTAAVADKLTDVERGHVTVDRVSYGLSYTKAAREAVEQHRDRDPKTLVAVGCSASKRDVKVSRAGDLYSSGYWTVKSRYGAEVGDDWGIISAKYGLLSPDEEIANYDRTVTDLEGIPVDGEGRLPNGDPVKTLLDEWAMDVYEGLSAWIDSEAHPDDPRDVELQIVLGDRYYDPLAERGVFDALRASGELTVDPVFQTRDFSGMGEQMSWMNEQVDAE